MRGFPTGDRDPVKGGAMDTWARVSDSDPGTRDPGSTLAGTWDQGAGTKDPKPRTPDPGSGTWDLGPSSLNLVSKTETRDG